VYRGSLAAQKYARPIAMATRKPPSVPDDESRYEAPPAERDPDTDDMFAGPAAAPTPLPPAATTGPGSASGEPALSPTTAEPYVVLARKYRPSTFADLIGQEAMVTTLRNAFATGRIAQGYMLTGVRGIGKTTTARILARALNYEATLPDGSSLAGPSIDMPVLGRHCREIMESRHPDVLEMDAASNTGVDNIRELIEGARYKPITARIKVYIIDEVHMLSRGAFNALLKTLEEPPAHVKFIFATTEIRKVPVTVLSRCQRFDLRRVDVPELAAHLGRIAAREGAVSEPQALALVARAAEGSVRDGLSLLDQAIAMGAGHVGTADVRAMLGLADRGRILDLIEVLLTGRAGEALALLDGLHRDGADPHQVVEDLAESVHIVTRTRIAGADATGDLLSAEERRRMAALAERLSVPLLSRYWQILLKGLEEVARAPRPIAAAEMLLVRLAHTADLPSPDEIIRALGGEAVSRRAAGTATTLSGQNEGRSQRPPGGQAAENQPAALPTPPIAVAPIAPAAPRAPVGPPPLASSLPEAPPDHPPAYLDDPEDPGFSMDAPPASLDPDEDDGDEREEYEGIAPLAARPPPPPPRPITAFADVVALAGDKRDAKLKVHLEEHVSLVAFDVSSEGTGLVELFLLPGAPKELANELREKLNAWTGRRWMVALARAAGAPTIGQVRRDRDRADLERLKQHPAVAAVLDAFPQAEIKSVRPLRRAAAETPPPAAASDVESKNDGSTGGASRAG
jgi:DNA polymerase-3 subunit gamma/tau